MRKRSIRSKRSGWQMQWRSAPVLAAIFAVGIGSFVLTSVNISAVNPMSQMAAEGTMIRGSPVSCEKARQKAYASKADNDGPATDTFVGQGEGAQTLSECYGAVITEEGRKARENPQKYGPLQPIEKHYECTGRESGVVTVDRGIVTAVSSPSGSPSNCPKNVVNKGLDDKDKGGQDKGGGQPPKGQEKPKDEGKGGEGMKPPEIPKPEQKPKEDPSGNPLAQCQSEADKQTKPECRGLQDQSLMGSLLNAGKSVVSGVGDVAKSAASAAGDLLSALAGPAAAEPAPSAVDSSASPESPIVPDADAQKLSPQDQSSPPPAPAPPPTPSYSPPASTGFEAMTPEDISKAQEELSTMERVLNNIIDFLKFWD